MHHSVFQVLAVHPDGQMEAGTAWFSADAQAYARSKFPHLAENSLYGLTNNHVVTGACSLFSRHVVCRRTDLPLSVCGVAADVDLAVVRLSGAAKAYLEEKLREKTGLTSVPLLPMMDSDKAVMPSQYDPLAVDANVVAIGHPLGSEFQTQTVGQVEGLKRVNMGASNLYMAHTATIQPGNSGGPLLYKNRVVGINSLKATGATTDNLNMAIPSRRIISYLPHILDERQQQLSAAVVNLAAHLETQTLQAHLLDSVAKESAVIGHAAAMETAYAEAMSCGDHSGHSCGGAVHCDSKRYPTLRSFVRNYAHRPGFHSLFSKVSQLLHSGETAKLRRMATGKGFDAHLCSQCETSAQQDTEHLYCVSPAPGKVVHSPLLGFDYKATSKLTRAALNAGGARGGVVVSKVLRYGTLSSLLKPYDIITEVHTDDGAMKLDEQGEHFKRDWGLSLGLADLVDRAPLGTQIAFKICRAGVPVTVNFTHAPPVAAERPAVRHLDASEVHLNAAIQVGGVAFKVLRMSDFADPRIAATAAKYGQPDRRHMEKVIVASVDPASAAFHNYSLMPGQVVSHVNQLSVTGGADGGAWRDFVQKLSGDAGRGGLAMLATECGGVDTLPVSEQEAAQLLQYLQSSACS